MKQPSSITILAIDREEHLALQDWSRGLDWVRWMLGDIRSHLPPLSTSEHAPQQEHEVLHDWQTFAGGLFQEVCGPLLRDCWQAAQGGRTRRLAQLAWQLQEQLPASVRERSTEAAHLLLRGTRHAMFQEVLGKHRAAIEEERCPAHFLPVWAALGSLFHLGLANITAEYLRLEWAMLSRHHPDLPEPSGPAGIVELTRGLLHGSPHALQSSWLENDPEQEPLKSGESA